MMKLWLPILLLTFPRFACAQVDPAPAGQLVRQYAAHYRVSSELVAALIDVESRWNPRALSAKGAMGLMQLMPATARRFGSVPADTKIYVVFTKHEQSPAELHKVSAAAQ